MGMDSSRVRGSGESASVACPAVDGRCSDVGSHVDFDLTYDASTGQMSGSVVTNLCPSHLVTGASEVDCVSQAIPDPAFDTANSPQAAPLLGRVALTLKEGNNIYGPLDAGFVDGQICDGGECDGGSDLTVCENQLIYQCGEENVNFNKLMDSCGGHANPYHHHTDLECDYDVAATASHSPAIAVSLDGYVIYGRWEGDGAAPVLDACNGHFGPVPANQELGITTGVEVYHYHSSDKEPYLVGCYGPVDSIAQCKSLYPSCNDNAYITTFLGLDGAEIDYNLWCPCYQHNGVRYGVGDEDVDNSEDADNSEDVDNSEVVDNTEDVDNSELVDDSEVVDNSEDVDDSEGDDGEEGAGGGGSVDEGQTTAGPTETPVPTVEEYSVQVVSVLTGVTAAELLANLAGFRAAVASVHVGASAEDVVVDEESIQEVEARRRLLAAGVSVAYEVKGFVGEAAAAAAAAAQESAGSSLAAELRGQGFTGLESLSSSATALDAQGSPLPDYPADSAAPLASGPSAALLAAAVTVPALLAAAC